MRRMIRPSQRFTAMKFAPLALVMMAALIIGVLFHDYEMRAEDQVAVFMAICVTYVAGGIQGSILTAERLDKERGDG